MVEEAEQPDREDEDELEEEDERPENAASESSRPFRRIERIVPEMIRKGLEKGIEAGLYTWEKNLEPAIGRTSAVPGAVKEAWADGKLPKEVASAFFSQIEDTKNGVLRVVAREFRDFLEATDLAGELKNALTSLSFEIRTEVRFIPNDAGTGVRPQVKAKSKVRQKEKEKEKEKEQARSDSKEPAASAWSRRSILRRSEPPIPSPVRPSSRPKADELDEDDDEDDDES